jgi:hypothetical protein
VLDAPLIEITAAGKLLPEVEVVEVEVEVEDDVEAELPGPATGVLLNGSLLAKRPKLLSCPAPGW